MNVKQTISELKKYAKKENREGMARFGINVDKALGVSVYDTRKVARKIKTDHKLALELWKTDIHEARMLATMIADPNKVTERLMDSWVRDFNSWDICDQTCLNLFDKTKFYDKKIKEWSKREEEFVKRAGFALIATSVWHLREVPDKEFLQFLPIIKREATDPRNFVKKAVNWSLRQMGKRSKFLNKHCLKTAREIAKIDSKAAKWIAKDAIRELESEAVKKRLQ
jgi:3-methyladenine DNA glycosylase AlkD